MAIDGGPIGSSARPAVRDFQMNEREGLPRPTCGRLTRWQIDFDHLSARASRSRQPDDRVDHLWKYYDKSDLPQSFLLGTCRHEDPRMMSQLLFPKRLALRLCLLALVGLGKLL